jgi:hypothetical protein
MRSPTATDDTTVNIEQAAKAVGVSRRVLYYWMAHKKLAYTTVRGSRRVILAAVRAAQQGSWAGRSTKSTRMRDRDRPGNSTSETSQRRHG